MVSSFVLVKYSASSNERIRDRKNKVGCFLTGAVSEIPSGYQNISDPGRLPKNLGSSPASPAQHPALALLQSLPPVHSIDPLILPRVSHHAS